MSAEASSHDLVPQTPARDAVEVTTGALERRVLTAAGRAANRAAAHHVFADYRQRRAEKTIRTQRAVLVLWEQIWWTPGPRTSCWPRHGRWPTLTSKRKMRTLAAPTNV
jgi:hypothetical protein